MTSSMRPAALFFTLLASCAVADAGSKLPWKCPKWLSGLCSVACIGHCLKPLSACIGDKGCKSSMINFFKCAAKNGKNATAATACMVPDNIKRDAFFNCAMEQHKCIPANSSSMPSPVYPKCNTSIAADANFKPAHMVGEWYKVHSWKFGEPVECFPCQKANFSLPAPNAVRFHSTWTEPDNNNKMWPMVVDATMHTEAQPGKLFNTGEMFGLTYWEPYTVVKDGSQEKEPYVLFYVCGGTLAGNYTTAFTLAKTPTLTPTLRTTVASQIANIGLKDSDFCNVDNSCFSKQSVFPL